MKRLLVILALVVAGCASGSSPGIPATPYSNAGWNIYHDIVHQVTCWSLYSNAISCIPDSQIKNPGG